MINLIAAIVCTVGTIGVGLLAARAIHRNRLTGEAARIYLAAFFVEALLATANIVVFVTR